MDEEILETAKSICACGAEGAVLTVEGSGMAALLLDNEAEAVT